MTNMINTIGELQRWPKTPTVKEQARGIASTNKPRRCGNTPGRGTKEASP